jgi:O-antigen ligase
MSKYFEKITWIFWIGLVATLPITSMPVVAKLIHSSAVAPASLIFLILLCLTWLPVYLWKKGTFPVQAKMALAFYVVGLISTGASYFLNLPAYKDQKIISSTVSGVATLSLGILFYLLVSTFPHNNEKVRDTLRILNWGGGVMLFWSILVGLITFITPGDTPNYLRTVQHLFSTTTFFGTRLVGFAAEPSWLAHILNMVYLPYWLSATLTGFSAQGRKFGRISLENIFLVLGFGTLFETLSRAGLFAFILVLGFFFIRFNIWIVQKIGQKWKSKISKGWITLATVLGLIAVYLGATTGVVFLLSKIDSRMEKVFSFETLQQGGITKYADTLQFGERVTYWQAGWNIFNAHPILGVGLGNAGYYFQEMLPDNAWSLSEVRRLVYHSTALMNIKSMWSRILAETGLVGFAFFLVLLVVTGFTSAELTRSPIPMKQVIGWMGISMLIAFVVEGFSVDSFALPYLWFTMGLVAATWRWAGAEKVGA